MKNFAAILGNVYFQYISSIYCSLLWLFFTHDYINLKTKISLKMFLLPDIFIMQVVNTYICVNILMPIKLFLFSRCGYAIFVYYISHCIFYTVTLHYFYVTLYLCHFIYRWHFTIFIIYHFAFYIYIFKLFLRVFCLSLFNFLELKQELSATNCD